MGTNLQDSPADFHALGEENVPGALDGHLAVERRVRYAVGAGIDAVSGFLGIGKP